MRVLVVEVGAVRVLVPLRLVGVPMTLLAAGGRIMGMVMVTVIVPVRVLVLDRFVHVPVSMVLGDVKVDTHREEQERADGRKGRPALPHEPGRDGAGERRQREDRSGAPGADASLREQVEPKAEAVAERAARKELDGAE